MVNGQEILKDSELALEGWNSAQFQESGVKYSGNMSGGLVFRITQQRWLHPCQIFLSRVELRDDSLDHITCSSFESQKRPWGWQNSWPIKSCFSMEMRRNNEMMPIGDDSPGNLVGNHGSPGTVDTEFCLHIKRAFWPPRQVVWILCLESA